MLIPYYGPLVLYLVSPARAKTRLAQMIEWMLGNSRKLEIWIGLAFGILFLVKGIGGLGQTLAHPTGRSHASRWRCTGVVEGRT